MCRCRRLRCPAPRTGTLRMELPLAFAAGVKNKCPAADVRDRDQLIKCHRDRRITTCTVRVKEERARCRQRSDLNVGESISRRIVRIAESEICEREGVVIVFRNSLGVVGADRRSVRSLNFERADVDVRANQTHKACAAPIRDR